MTEAEIWVPGKRNTLSAAPFPEDDAARLGPFSCLRLAGERAHILTSHFGKFRARVAVGDARQRLSGFLAFSCSEAMPVSDAVEPPRITEGSGCRDESEAVDVADFWPCRVTYAVDMITGGLIRLVWGLNVEGALLTLVRPDIDLTGEGRENRKPRLLGIGRETYVKLATAIRAASLPVPEEVETRA